MIKLRCYYILSRASLYACALVVFGMPWAFIVPLLLLCGWSYGRAVSQLSYLDYVAKYGAPPEEIRR